MSELVDSEKAQKLGACEVACQTFERAYRTAFAAVVALYACQLLAAFGVESYHRKAWRRTVDGVQISYQGNENADFSYWPVVGLISVFDRGREGDAWEMKCMGQTKVHVTDSLEYFDLDSLLVRPCPGGCEVADANGRRIISFP